MKEYVLDANAIIRFMKPGGGAGVERVRALVDQAQRGVARLSMSAINLGEVFYILLRHMDEPAARQRIEALRRIVSIIEVDSARALEAAAIEHRHKLGYADSFAAALAMERGAMLVSADPEFERCGKALKWMRLPPFVR